MSQVIIIGGGLAGIISGIRLARKNIDCTIIEKKEYPFHRVCGEYISNETLSFLKSEGLYPEEFNPPQITEFQLSSVRGKTTNLPLDLGGFGISRYTFDNFLYKKAAACGVKFLLNTEVSNVLYKDNIFQVSIPNETLICSIVIGAFGKRSKIDAELKRPFFKKRSPYAGIKYHIRTPHPPSLIALHNFNGGYCGVSNIEEGKTNLCYLTKSENIKRFKNLRQMEESVLFENRHLREIFLNSEFLFQKPEVINEISFETKEPVWNHILMTGDAAGMIAPLCGNGMAMAIHSAKILSDIISEHLKRSNFSQTQLEKEYTHKWDSAFRKRLAVGRFIQNNLFGSEWSSNIAVTLGIYSKALTSTIIKNTHGNTF